MAWNWHNCVGLVFAAVNNYHTIYIYSRATTRRVPGYPLNYPTGYPGAKLPGYASPSHDVKNTSGRVGIKTH